MMCVRHFLEFAMTSVTAPDQRRPRGDDRPCRLDERAHVPREAPGLVGMLTGGAAPALALPLKTEGGLDRVRSRRGFRRRQAGSP
jgi:hypothetical protein